MYVDRAPLKHVQKLLEPLFVNVHGLVTSFKAPKTLGWSKICLELRGARVEVPNKHPEHGSNFVDIVAFSRSSTTTYYWQSLVDIAGEPMQQFRADDVRPQPHGKPVKFASIGHFNRNPTYIGWYPPHRKPEQPTLKLVNISQQHPLIIVPHPVPFKRPQSMNALACCCKSVSLLGLGEESRSIALALRRTASLDSRKDVIWSAYNSRVTWDVRWRLEGGLSDIVATTMHNNAQRRELR
jgi:hypothetical protein